MLEPRRLFSTYTVNSLSDSLANAPGILTLRHAVDAANAHAGSDTINFSAAVFPAGALHTITLLHGEVPFKDTTGATVITGPGSAVVAVSSNGSDRIFEVLPNVRVTMSGITVTKGAANKAANGNVYGGGIYNAGTLGLDSVSVTNNHATNTVAGGFGGGIYNSHTLSIVNCTISSNTVKGSTIDGGPASGGGIYSAGTFSLLNSTISNNVAYCYQGSTTGGTASGGGIYLANPSAVTFTGATISGNTASAGDSGNVGFPGGAAAGGGVYSQGNLIINAGVISNNTATSGETWGGINNAAAGGGIDSNGDLVLNQSTVSGNSALGGNAAYNGITGGPAQGGGISCNGYLDIFQSTVSTNHAYGGAGNGGSDPIQNTPVAGGYGSGGGIWTQGDTTITDSTVANNIAGGGVGSPAGPSDVGGTAGGNGGAGSGGGIWTNVPLEVADSTVSGNSAVGGAGGASYIYIAPPHKVLSQGGLGGSFGGGISTVPAFTLLTNSIVSGNHANNPSADISGNVKPASAYNLVGLGGGLVNGLNGNRVGIINPKLLALGNFGGPTQTMPPSAASVAIDAGKNALIPAGMKRDQRLMPRIVGPAVDIGAVEFSQVVIQGNVFNDINGNGVKQASDPNLKNWQIYVDLTNAGVYVRGDPLAITDALGNYTITYAPIGVSGHIIVREDRPDGWRRTKPAGIYPLGFYSIDPAAGTVKNINFGNSATSLIAGTVYRDSNNNKTLDTGEAGLAGWTVRVDYLVGTVWHDNVFATTTDSRGNYSFVLSHGTYRIHEVVRSGFTPTSPAAAGYSLTVGTGATVTGENFGNR